MNAPLPLWLAILGIALLMAGSSVVTWLVTDLAVQRQRRRADQLEEALHRTRAQARQRRQPHEQGTRGTVPMPQPPASLDRAAQAWDAGDPTWADQVAEALREQAPTVLMGAMTPAGVRTYRQLGGGRQ